jgi:hypothetical protein
MTDLRASQVAGEAWVVTTADKLLVSQVVGEVWLRHIPVTMLIASQALAEVWVPSPGPRQPLRVSSQLV